MTLYAYIMTNDDGGAPNPFDDDVGKPVCTLAYCMPMTRRAAKEGDYVVGLAGAKFRELRWKIIYAMKVEKNLSFDAYDKLFPSRQRGSDKSRDTDHVLVSRVFTYWGEKARSLPPKLDFLKKRFPSNASVAHRRDFSTLEVQAFKAWFNKQARGQQGMPYHWEEDEDTALCIPRSHRKKC